MYDFETVTPVGREAERVVTAFYRFLEITPPPEDADICVRTEVAGDRQRCVIRLWSPEAIDEFRAYLTAFRTPKPNGLLQEFGGRG